MDVQHIFCGVQVRVFGARCACYSWGFRGGVLLGLWRDICCLPRPPRCSTFFTCCTIL